MNIAADHYYIKFLISTCQFEIRINDIAILRFPGPGSMGTKLYINQYIHSGENMVTINMLPLPTGFEYTSRAEVSVWHTKNGVETKLSDGEWRWDKDHPVPAWSLSQAFAVKEKIEPESPWLQQKEGELTNDQRSDINQRFRQIVAAFQSKNLDRVMELTAARDSFYEQRYHLAGNERYKEIRNAMSNVFKTCEFIVHPPEEWIFRSYAGKRLFSFELSNFTSPITFQRTGTDMRASIPVLFTYDDTRKLQWIL